MVKTLTKLRLLYQTFLCTNLIFDFCYILTYYLCPQQSKNFTGSLKNVPVKSQLALKYQSFQNETNPENLLPRVSKKLKIAD